MVRWADIPPKSEDRENKINRRDERPYKGSRHFDRGGLITLQPNFLALPTSSLHSPSPFPPCSLDPLLESAIEWPLVSLHCLLYSMIPNHSREHFQSNLSRADLVHSQYSRVECPTCLRGRFRACVRPSATNSLVAASLSTLVRIPPRALGPRGLTSISFVLFPSFALSRRRLISPVKLFDILSCSSHPLTHILYMVTLAADG